MDRNFDDLYEKLKKKVYGSRKGRLRLELLREDLNPVSEASDPLKILDAGGGFGQISLDFARRGHNITFCDISEKMLEEAWERFKKADVADRISLVHKPFQEIAKKESGDYDLVLSHAVLEWVDSPEDAFQSLVSALRPGGTISLMFYNLNSLVCQNVIKGNFYKVMKEAFSGDPNSLTPMNPVPAEKVYGWFPKSGLTIMSKTGVRIFYDLMKPELRRERSFEDIIAIERKYCAGSLMPR